MNFRLKDGLIKLTFFLIVFLTFKSTQAAKLYFNDIYKANGSSYTIQPSSLNGISSITGSGFKFTSANPADVSFSGNNIAGILTYTNSSNQQINIYGVISRQNKANGNTMAVNFMPTDNTYTTVTGEGYILVIPSKEGSFQDGNNVGTSSDPIASVLNDVLATQNSSPIISVNDVTVNNTDSYAVFTISLSRVANAITTFTPTVSSVTATLNTDYTNSMQYYNGSTWVNISTTVSIAQNATSIQIRVPILNSGAVSNKTFNLNTGTVTGSNVLNSDGAYGIGTILPTPAITFSGTLSAFTTCANIASAAQFFTISGTYLTSNIVIGSLTGYEYALSANGTYSSSLTIAPTNGNITNTAIYVRLSSSATTGAGGNITISSTGATTQNVATGSATINSVQFNSTPVLTVLARNQYLYSLTATTNSNNSITFTSTTTLPAWLSLSSSAQTNGQQIGGTISSPGAVAGDLNGNIYAVENSGTKIWKIAPDGTTTQFAIKNRNTYTYGGAIVIGHYLYISYYTGSNTGGIAQYDINVVNPTGVDLITGVDFLSLTYNNGFLYGANYSGSKIYKIAINEASPASSTSSVYISNSYVSSPFGLAFNASGDLFVAEYNSNVIKKFAAGSTTTSSLVLTGLSSNPSDVKIDANNNIYISFSGSLPIRKYTPDLSSYITVSGATNYVWGMSLNANGTLFYGDFSGNKIYTLQTNANLSGTPQTPQVGQYPIVLKANDLNCNATQNFTITVLPNVPMPVTSQSATAGYGSATVTFTPPTDNGGATVTSYTVISSPGNYSVTSSGSPVTITGLTSGTSYTFQIYATNSVGNSTIVTTAPITVLSPPSLTTGTLKTFTSCSGCTIQPQSFTVAGTNLSSSIVVTAPNGFEVSNATSGTYSSTLSLTPTSGTLATTNVYARLINSATNASSGIFTVASTGAISKTVTATVNTDNALNFDGVNDIVSTASNITSLNITGDITVETWIRLNQMPSDYVRLIGKGSPDERTYGLWLYSDGSLLWQQYTPGIKNLITNSSIIPVGKWTHIAVTRIGSNVKIYLNGVELATSISFIGTANSSTAPLQIGGSSSIHALLNGSMDEVRIWNVGRTSSQISNSYLSELVGDGNANETGLVAYYNFNQGIAGGSNSSISVIEDRTSNGFSGTLTNFAKSGSTSNFVAGFVPEISGQSILNKGLTTNYTNGLTGGTWSSSNTNIATVNASTGVVTGVNPGTSTITYSVCEKTVTNVVTVVEPTITKTGSLTAFNTCLGTASAAQTFTVSAQYLTANMVLTAPAGYELSTDGATYSSNLSIAPTAGTVSARSIYVRLSTASVNGQSGNISITSTGVTTQNLATGTASVTRTVAASVTISSNATNNTICAGSNIVFTANPTNGGIAPTFQWKLNGTNITGANSATYSTTSLANNDVITVLMGSSLTSCVTGSPASSNSITTTVTSIPSVPGNINGAAIICMNSNQVYSIAAIAGATSYTWVVTGGITASPSTTNVLNVTAANNAGSGTIKVLASNACGSSVYSNDFNVTISNQPAPTASFTVSGNTVCLTNAGITFTSTSTPNATTSSTITSYLWDFGDGSTASTATANNTYTTSGTFDAILTIQDANQCTSSFSNRVTVDPFSVAGTATALNSIICEGASTSLNLAGSIGTIQWQKSSDNITFTNISNATSSFFNTGNLTATTYYRAVVTSGSCSSATSGVVTVTVNPTPSVTLGSVSNIYSNATSFDLAYSGLVGNPDEYSINAVGPNALPNFSAISNFGLISSPINIVIPASVAGTYNFNFIAKNGIVGCTSSPIPFTVTIAAPPPAGLSYITPNVYTTGVTITALNPTSTGGTITSYSVSPNLPAGLTINTGTGLITGTPTTATAQANYIVTGTNVSGTVTATVVITVNSNVVPQPQGSIDALDFKLLASDSVNLKFTVSNGTAPFTLILNNSYTNTKDTLSNLTPVNNEVRFKLKQLDSTKTFTIFKIIDANNNERTSGFTKDTTKVDVLKPKIVLTLKADPAVKQADNSFKTKLLLKVKNAGDIDLRNVQVNANLSTVFPVGISYVLDSVRVLNGNFSINPNYTGAGSATSPTSVQNFTTVTNKGNKNSFSVLDPNYLFNNGVSLNKNEEGEVVYYVSIGATTQNVTLKLQFETAGSGILTKNDGSTSAQATTSKSNDGTNINQHPSISNIGLPLPTYVPLFPNEKIGSSLSVSASKPVTGGYEFHFIAKIKNFGNVNLDSIRIEYDLNKMFPNPDQALLVSNPTITRGNLIYNVNNYNGNSNINLFNYGGNLQVGDSATYEYDLKVTTNRIAYTWPNYFVVFARSLNSGLVINDTSMAGLNPDPNNDNDPIEKFYTNATINFAVPAPPVVENKTYVFGTNIPSTIGGLVKSTPTGTVPVWCNEKTAACSLNPPSTPLEIGKYIFALRSYDTATLLYSDVIVYDTVIIKPPVPTVNNKKYIIGVSTNPSNIASQVTGLIGSSLKYFKNAIVQSIIPVLGTTAGVVRYTASQTVNEIESDTVGFTVEMLDSKNLIHLQKIASEPRLMPNSTFNIVYSFIVTNRTSDLMTNVTVADNLLNTFPSPTSFEVLSVATSGGLVSNITFNGKTDIHLLKTTSQLASNAVDTIRLTLNIQPKGYYGVVNNIATITATSPNGTFSLNSSSTSFANETIKTPTPLSIPDLAIDIPEAFSPNRDGVNDRFVIVKPYGSTLVLEVFNRWGNIVYSNANYNNEWDGRGTNNFIGQDLMDGGYYYTLKVKYANGNIQNFKGFVIIQR